MTRVVFVSEIPVAYRHRWFAHLRSHSALDVRVLYLAGTQSDRPWESPIGQSDWCRLLPSRSLTASQTGFFARVTPTIGRELASERPDFVLLPGWAHPSSWHAAAWCCRNNVPYGVMFENWKPQRKTSLPASATDRIRSAVLERAAVALPTGLRAARFAELITNNPIRVLHTNVTDVDEARKASINVKRDSQKRVLYIGRLMPHKGIEIVLDMAASLESSGIGVEVAGDGPGREAVKSAAQQGLVTFHGTVIGDHKYGLMARSTMVIVPSLAEPWGVVVQEALATGTPVLASTEVGCAPEFLEAGVTGAVVAADRGAFESTVRSWINRAEPNRDACVTKAESINYSTVASELENVVADVLR